MKRFVIIFVLIFLIAFSFCSCGEILNDSGGNKHDFGGMLLDSGDNDDVLSIGAWLSYFELKPKKEAATESEYKAQLSPVFDNLKKIGVTDLFVHVRPFADAIYPSPLFPSSSAVVKKQGDKLPFDFFAAVISEAKARGITVHAWINPYRVQNVLGQDALADGSAAKKWLDEKSPDVFEAGGGLWFNPASERVRALIADGVRELLCGYDIGGIHLDDYFYPETVQEADLAQFEEYQKSGGGMSLASWRRENVSLLLKELYKTVKSFGEDKILSVSPAGDIEKNMNVLYADVKRWAKEDGFLDVLIPQIYFGFENSSFPFEKTALEWKSLVKNNAQIWAGLALYKQGEPDIYAGKGKGEWENNDDVIARQTKFAIENGFDAVSLYSANFVNFNQKETQNLYNMLY